MVTKRKQFELATSEYGKNPFMSLDRPRNITTNNTMENGFDEDYPIYSMTVKSAKMSSARKSLPFNVNNISKHSIRAKLSNPELQSPRSTNFS